MEKKVYVIASILGLLGILLFFMRCSSLDPEIKGDPVTDISSFVQAMRINGLNVDPRGEVSQPFLTVPGQGFLVNGAEIQAYEYATVTEAKAIAKQFSPDGESIDLRSEVISIRWIATPHLYQKEKLVVIYLGDDEMFLKMLRRLLGEPFTERK